MEEREYVVRISTGQVDEIIAHARAECPNEACGILAGRDGAVTKVYRMANRDRSPESYFMEPGEQIKVMKEIRKNSGELLGIYHSHVASPARPSAQDIELAFYPDAAYLIVSLENREAPSVRGFRITGGKVEEIALRIEDDRDK